MMLSLPDDWNYTTRGLAKICKEGVDAIGSALRELETAGYIVRNQLRDQQGRISDTEYVIYHTRGGRNRRGRIRLYQIRLHQIRKTRIWINRIRKSPQN